LSTSRSPEISSAIRNFAPMTCGRCLASFSMSSQKRRGTYSDIKVDKNLVGCKASLGPAFKFDMVRDPHIL
jgi:hypothetical protein